MGSAQEVVIYSFVLYLLNVLVPLIPAVIIYRLFPDTKVAVKGPLAGLSIKASGAFSAYIVVVLLGFFLVKDISTSIKGLSKETWTVRTEIKLTDKDDKVLSQLDQQRFLENIAVKIESPEPIKITGKKVKFFVPNVTSSRDVLLNFDIPGFAPIVVNPFESNKVIDNKERTIDLGEIVLIKYPVFEEGDYWEGKQTYKENEIAKTAEQLENQPPEVTGSEEGNSELLKPDTVSQDLPPVSE